jgi:Arc/MetJ-type ribon-helix-helix transcriptional regulator
MTPKRKIAVSLPAELVEAAKRAVATGRAPNVSAFVADALEDKVNGGDLRDDLEQSLAASGGPLTEAEIRWADSILGIPEPASG